MDEPELPVEAPPREDVEEQAGASDWDRRPSRLPVLSPSALDAVLAMLVTLVAGVLRFVRLDIPKKLIPLDEFYYPVNALGIMRYGADHQLAGSAKLPALDCASVAIEPAFAVHPPVGKWFIGLGMKIFGCNSFGWRIGAALLGTATVLLVFLIARRLFKNSWAAALAALLIALDGLHFVQSRIAMLDIYVTFFIALAVWLLVEDRARTTTEHRGIRWWRIGAGIAIGLGLATKWSAGFVIPILIILAVVWELDRRRAALRRSMLDALATEPPAGSEGLPIPEPVQPGGGMGFQWIRIMGAFLLVPVLVYIIAYLPWFSAGGDRYKAPRCERQSAIKFDGLINPVNSRVWNLGIWPDDWQEWVCYQREIYDFHKNLNTFKDGKPSHPYLARAWSWPWMGRPTSHFFASKGPPDQKQQAEILGLPNPGMWFPAFWLAIPFCIWQAIRRRDQAAAVLLLLFAPLFLPWLLQSRPLFLFYMTPGVPILALMTAYFIYRAATEFRPLSQAVAFTLAFTSPLTPWIIQRFHEGTSIQYLYKIPMLLVMLIVVMGLCSLMSYAPRPWKKTLGGMYLGWVMLLFAYFYPVLAAVYIPDAGPMGWRNHMWLQRDCGRQEILLTCWI